MDIGIIIALSLLGVAILSLIVVSLPFAVKIRERNTHLDTIRKMIKKNEIVFYNDKNEQMTVEQIVYSTKHIDKVRYETKKKTTN